MSDLLINPWLAPAITLLCAVAVVCVALWSSGRSSSQVIELQRDFKALAEAMKTFELAVSARKAAREESARYREEAAAEALLQTSGRIRSVAVPPALSSPLAPAPETAATRLAATINRFGQELADCASSVGLAPEEFAPRIGSLGALMKQARSAYEPRLEQDWWQLATQTMQIVLSTCDLDLDPKRQNTKLQGSLDLLARLSATRIIKPEIGDRFEPDLHARIGTLQDPRGIRGTVAEVRARGLMTGNGRVLAKAQVREFD